jgi:hypothetical protein
MKSRFSNSFAFLLFVLTVASVVQTEGAGAAGDGEFDRIVDLTQKIRGLDFKDPVKFERLSKPDLSKMLKEELSRLYSEEDWRLMQSSLVLLGAIPEELELKEFLYDLMSDQIAGLYDPHTKRMYVVGDLSLQVGLTQIVLEHELTHAVTDQHFDLLSLPIEEIHNDDRSQAALALVEGDATLSMIEYAQELDISDALTTLIVSLFMNQDTFEAAPPYFQASLIFPYLGGEVFLLEAMTLYTTDGDRLVERSKEDRVREGFMNWKLVDYFYTNPPKSTEQILHPEKIGIDPDEPVEVVLEPLPQELTAVGYEPRWENSMGEFSIKSLLMNSLSPLKATRAAEGWGGDRYVLLENDSGGRVLHWKTVWDTERDAQEFRDAYELFSGGEAFEQRTIALLEFSDHPNEVIVRIGTDEKSLASVPSTDEEIHDTNP